MRRYHHQSPKCGLEQRILSRMLIGRMRNEPFGLAREPGNLVSFWGWIKSQLNSIMADPFPYWIQDSYLRLYSNWAFLKLDICQFAVLNLSGPDDVPPPSPSQNLDEFSYRMHVEHSLDAGGNVLCAHSPSQWSNSINLFPMPIHIMFYRFYYAFREGYNKMS